MKIVWTDPCVEDLQPIHDYIARDSEYYAADLVERLILSVQRLLQFPSLGRRVRETQNENIRELVLQNYRIIYRIAGQQIEVLTIVHGRRDLTRRRRVRRSDEEDLAE